MLNLCIQISLFALNLINSRLVRLVLFAVYGPAIYGSAMYGLVVCVAMDLV